MFCTSCLQYIMFIMAWSLCHWRCSDVSLASPEVWDVYSLIFNVVGRPTQRDGAPTGTQYRLIGRHLSPLQTPVLYKIAFTASKTEFRHTVLVAEQHLMLKHELLLHVLQLQLLCPHQTVYHRTGPGTGDGELSPKKDYNTHQTTKMTHYIAGVGQ